MSMKQYIVTKDIYHKGKLIKNGTLVASETGHKYFKPYKKPEFSDGGKEAPTLVIAPDKDSNVKYDDNGVVIPTEESRKAASAKKISLKLKDDSGKESDKIISEAKGQAKKIIDEALKKSAPKNKSTKASKLADDEEESKIDWEDKNTQSEPEKGDAF